MAIVAMILCGPRAYAINIILDYETENNSEDPNFDANGAKLIAVMQAAVAHWESIILDDHDLTIRFWYTDLDDGTHLCMYGLGVEKNYRVAMDWFVLAAKQGLPDAKFNIGVMHEKGWGVPADRDEAISWYREAAKGGDKPAEQRLRDMNVQD